MGRVPSIKMVANTIMAALLLLLPVAMAGVNDTVDQLRNGFTIVPLSDQGIQEPVIVDHGAPPEWLSGTLARHACGVYGETGRTFLNEDGEKMINACDHVFDCIEMGQGYHFHQGQVTFTSRFYDTDHVALWRNMSENMNYTSVWWGTVYAHQNTTAKEYFNDWTLKAGSPRDLIPDTELNHSFEFSNINPSYLGKKYKFGYFSENVFKLDGAVVKVNVDTGETIQKKLPNGLFPTEPLFVARPGAVDEDDGEVVMSGIDGGKEKGYVIIYNAADMKEIFRATSTKKTLFGVHSKFYSFTDGCSQPGGDCTPEFNLVNNPDNAASSHSTSSLLLLFAFFMMAAMNRF